MDEYIRVITNIVSIVFVTYGVFALHKWKKIADMASDVLQMAYAINQHLFGKGPVQSEGKEPKCFRDALKIHADLIGCVAEEMRNICDSLGV